MKFFILISIRDESYKVFQSSNCLISDAIEFLLDIFREFCRRNREFSRANKSKRKMADFSDLFTNPTQKWLKT